MASPNTSADIFANSSTETVTQNESGLPSDSLPAPVLDEQTEQSLLQVDASALASNLMSELPARICCPFCTLDFGFEPLLKDHIKASHARELQTVFKSKLGQMEFFECPFCRAKFYLKELLPKHIIRKHELCVVNMFSGFSPEKYVYCRFCPHKTMRKHYKLLMIHIEKRHLAAFEKFIIAKYSNVSNSIENLVEECAEPVYDTPGLSDTHKVGVDRSQFKSILKPQTAYPIEQSDFNPETVVDYANTNIPHRITKRKLRFDLPDSPDDKENTHGKRFKWKTLSKRSDPAETSLATHLSRFKCGLCSESFDLNETLLEHQKIKHKGFQFKARYKCGECTAKFYRNSFLVKHCWQHHAPLCLKTPAPTKETYKF